MNETSDGGGVARMNQEPQNPKAINRGSCGEEAVLDAEEALLKIQIQTGTGLFDKKQN